MFKRKKAEWAPWYRRKDYRGSFTEADKRKLDAFRSAETHPATDPASLPKDVQGYIGHVEMENYDSKQQRLADAKRDTGADYLGEKWQCE